MYKQKTDGRFFNQPSAYQSSMSKDYFSAFFFIRSYAIGVAMNTDE